MFVYAAILQAIVSRSALIGVPYLDTNLNFQQKPKSDCFNFSDLVTNTFSSRYSKAVVFEMGPRSAAQAGLQLSYLTLLDYRVPISHAHQLMVQQSL